MKRIVEVEVENEENRVSVRNHPKAVAPQEVVEADRLI